MFYKAEGGVYRVEPLDRLDWLVHGFGTRHSQIPANIATIKQIHSDRCIVADAGVNGHRGDALLSRSRLVGVKTADCLPIFLVDERNRAVAVVHAGWRGTVQGIAEKALEAMRRNYRTNPIDVHAAIGPGIGECCFEVGPEVASEFGLSGRAHVNLAGENRRQLETAGVRRIYEAALCTVCRECEFHSYRRDKDRAGRMISFLGPCGI